MNSNVSGTTGTNKISVPAPSRSAQMQISGHLSAESTELFALDAYEKGRLKIAVCGHPWWRDDKYARLAKSGGHAKAIFQAYQDHSESFLDQLAGSFVFIIINPSAQYTFAAIDRMGIQALCYYSNAEQVFFDRSADKIALARKDSSLELQSVFNYLYFHTIPSPDSIYSGIKKLTPGSYLKWQAGKLETGYYQKHHYQESNLSKQQLAGELQKKLGDAVSRCYTTPNTGAFLSGGLDSSTIAGLLAEKQANTLTYSIGFDADGYDEMEYARTTAKHFSTQQHEYYLKPQDVVSAIPIVAASYDSPFGNSSAIPTYYCAKMAHENGSTDLLAGDGGDELFAGNTRYQKQIVFEHYFKIPEFLRTHLFDSLASKLSDQAITPLRKLKSYIEQANVRLPQRLQTYNYLHRFPQQQLFNTDFLAQVNTDYPDQLFTQTYAQSEHAHTLDRMLRLDWKFTLADNDIRKVNGMCEAAGIQVHYPFLDDELVNFSTQIPSQLKLKATQLRYFYKWAMRDYLPDKVLSKSKHGFGLPFGVWIQTHPALQSLAYDSLNDLKKRQWLEASFIDRIIELHRNDHAHYYGEFIWVLMMLEVWLQQHQM